ncbi:substrate-binding domain-containing protein [Paenarthrobacter sp. NPDC057981]|uniref:substrate-binding domain-containing protein n=1 Tax=Paenarthrobacter sp. NPDC057981 TaxID=3346297 RepID=UPI0036DE4205
MYAWHQRARRGLTALAVLATTLLATAGCSSVSPESGGDDKPYTIGFSNTLLSQEPRVQMLEGLKAAAQPYIDAGKLAPIVEEVANTDVQGQVRQIQSLMNRQVDCIVLTASSVTGLNPILTQAMAQGIKVIVMDNFIDLEGVINVGADYRGNFERDARWVMDQMGGQGKLLRVDGIAGYPADQLGIDAVNAARADNPGVDIAGTLNGDWDTATAVQVTSSWLAAGNVPDGVWASGGGVAYGVLQSLLSANVNPLPAINGEGSVGWLRLAAKTKASHPDFNIYSANLIQPQGIGSAALQVAMEVLENGSQPKESKPLLLPVLEITNDNYQQLIDKSANLPDSATYSGDLVTREQALNLWF